MAKTVDEIYDFALSLFGRPYIWGANGEYTKWSGYDCSSYVLAVLHYAKMGPPGDHTADAIYRFYEKLKCPEAITRGSLAFFGTQDLISHVGICIDDRCIISAAGGGSYCKSIDASRRFNAHVKIQPIAWYKGPSLVKAILPPYHLGGLRI